MRRSPSRIATASVIPRPAPPYFLRNRNPNPAAVGDLPIELVREAVVLIALGPVFVGKGFAEFPDRPP